MLDFLKKLVEIPDAQQSQVHPVLDQISSLLRDTDNPEYLACFAFVLGRVAYADRDFQNEEKLHIQKALQEMARLSEIEASKVVHVIEEQIKIQEGVANYLVTRHFGQIASREQKSQLMKALFAVAASDESVTSQEEAELKQIAAELKISDGEFVEIRSEYREYREVLKGLR